MTQKELAQYGAVTVSVEDEAAPLTAVAAPVGEDEGESWVKAHDVELAESGGAQPRFRDITFAVLFYAHLAAMIYVGVTQGSWGEEDASTPSSGDTTHLTRVVCYLVIPSIAISFGLAYLFTAAIVPYFPETAVKASVIMSLVWTGVVTLLVIISAPGFLSIIIMGAFFALMCWYVKKVWRLIPFAAVNLKAALKGMSANWGMYLVAICFTTVLGVWVVFWMYAATGVFLKEEAQDVAEGEPSGQVHWGILFLLLVSLYWTIMLLLNMIQTTVAGVMGTWCLAKEDAQTCCSPAVTSSLYRTCTYSFGSVCLGSLLEAIIKALRVMAEMAKNQARNSDDDCSGGAAILFCILECILRLMEDIIEYFNQWAYVFVGIYGFSYIESGRKVMELFRARGWTALITDDLVGYVLNVTAFTVAIFTGLIAVGIEAGASSGMGDGTSYLFGVIPEDGLSAGWSAFLVGSLLGLFIACVMTNVIKGAVNTVVVCYADSPAMLEQNHPALTYEMATSWVAVFPDCGVRVPPREPVATVVV